METEVVVGIDPGKTTGFCVSSYAVTESEDGEAVELDLFSGGIWKLTKSGRSYIDVLYQNLRELIQGLEKVDLLCYEEPVARGMAARSLNRQIAAIILACEHEKVPHYPVNPGTLKKFATGVGNAAKEEMISAANGCGYMSEDHNEVDAFWLSVYGMDQVLPTLKDMEEE